MYTFILSAVFFLLLSGIIFRKSIKKNQFFIILIVFLGTMAACVTVNGIAGKHIPLTFVKIKEKVLLNKRISTIELRDTTIKLKAYIGYNIDIDEDNDTIANHIAFNSHTYIDTNDLVFNYLDGNDTIPRWERIQERRLVTNRWIVPFGLPRGKTYINVYLPNDSTHNELMSYVNKYFYENKSI
jgi:hypothetical protein